MFINPKKMKTTQEQVARLQEIADEAQGTMRAKVALDSLESDDPLCYLSDVRDNGCSSGIASDLIYYTDTAEFFDSHEEEIGALLAAYKEETGEVVPYSETIKNDLAWAAYEIVADNLSSELEELPDEE
jgi:hypothetical protein